MSSPSVCIIYYALTEMILKYKWVREHNVILYCGEFFTTQHNAVGTRLLQENKSENTGNCRGACNE